VYAGVTLFAASEIEDLDPVIKAVASDSPAWWREFETASAKDFGRGERIRTSGLLVPKQAAIAISLITERIFS
jgi:hypothetical protein